MEYMYIKHLQKKTSYKKNTKYGQLQPGQEFISTTHL